MEGKKVALIEGGKIAAAVLAKTLGEIVPGVSTEELDRRVEERIKKAGARPSFKGFKNYPFATCININEGVVHGVPSSKAIVGEGDLVTVDLGVFYKGYHTDTAKTILVRNNAPAFAERFLEVGRLALERALAQCRSGQRIGDISYAIQKTIGGAGYHVIRELVGHGIGRKLHQPPDVPGYGRRGEGALLIKGLTLAVEVIYSLKETRLKRLDDGWTLVAARGCPAAMFEHSVLITDAGPIVLTAGEG